MRQKHVHPTPEQLKLLSRFERCSFKLVDFVNSNTLTKRAAHFYLKTFGAGWVGFCTRNLVHIVGGENLHDIKPHSGLLLVSNHRSLFDQYVLSCWLFRTTDLLQRLYFPVKSTFFYDRPIGVLVSMIMSALAMYPPVFRQPSKRDFNSYSLQRMIDLLQTPGSVVGIHPEGTRNKGHDPYTLLKAQPGIGKLILEAKPTVIPAFINGLCDKLVHQVGRNFKKNAPPIIIVIGKPIDLQCFYAKPNRLRTQKETADYVLAEIAKLGTIERQYREQLTPSPVRGPVHR